MQMWMLGANHQAELGNPGGGAGGRIRGVKGDCNPIGRTILAGWTILSSQGLDINQPVYREGSMVPDTYIAKDGLV